MNETLMLMLGIVSTCFDPKSYCKCWAVANETLPLTGSSPLQQCSFASVEEEAGMLQDVSRCVRRQVGRTEKKDTASQIRKHYESL